MKPDEVLLKDNDKNKKPIKLKPPRTHKNKVGISSIEDVCTDISESEISFKQVKRKSSHGLKGK